MPESSLEGFKLVLLSLRLLPSFFNFCFCAIVLAFREQIGTTKNKLDLVALLLTKEDLDKGGDIDTRLCLTIVALVVTILVISTCAMLTVLLQMAGLERPACLLQLYPDYLSKKLKMRRAATDTVSIIYFIGSVSFVLSLSVGVCINLSARREITQAKKEILHDSIRRALLEYKLEPWKGVNMDRLLDKIQTNFSCCGINNHYDYALAPRKKGASWEAQFFDRSFAAANSGLKIGEQLVDPPPPESCCLKTDTGRSLNCSSLSGPVIHSLTQQAGSIQAGKKPRLIKLHRTGCYARVLLYMEKRQAQTEQWSFMIGASVAVMGGMAYWAQAM